MKDRLAEVVDEVVITGQNTGEKMCSCESDVVDETCSSESYDACGNGGAIVKKALIVLNKTQGHYLPLCQTVDKVHDESRGLFCIRL